jgi:hypothetical protein
MTFDEHQISANKMKGIASQKNTEDHSQSLHAFRAYTEMLVESDLLS